MEGWSLNHWTAGKVCGHHNVCLCFVFLKRQAVPTDLILLSNPSCLNSKELHPWPLSISLSLLSARDEEAFHLITEVEELDKCSADLLFPFLSGACVLCLRGGGKWTTPPGMGRQEERDSSPAVLGRKEGLLLKLSFSQCAARMWKLRSP